MTMGLENFRGVRGDRLILQQDVNGSTGVRKSEIPFKNRVVHFILDHGKSYHGTQAQKTENIKFKTTFLEALVKAEGPEVAEKACRKAGLPIDWETSTKPMSDKQVKLVLDKAQQCRKQLMKETEKDIKTYLKGTTPPCLMDSFVTANPRLPPSDVNNKELHALFRRELKLDPDYAKTRMTPEKLDEIGQRTIAKFEARKEAQFREAHPGLAGFLDGDHIDGLNPDSRSFFTDMIVKLSPSMSRHPLTQEPQEFRMLAQAALEEIRSTKDLMAKMAYNPDGWEKLENELWAKSERLSNIVGELMLLGHDEMPKSDEGKALCDALLLEMRHQDGLLLSKKSFIDDIRNSDPLSYQKVAYSNLLWAQAAGKIVDKAIEEIRAQHGDSETGNRLVQDLLDVKRDYIDMMTTRFNVAQDHPDDRTEAPSKENKKTHPAATGKSEAMAFLKAALEGTGLPKETIKELLSKESISGARRQALNENQTWTPITRDMVVTKDGVTRVYRSIITPGSSINDRFARRYNDPGLGGLGEGDGHSPRGISSATKGDLYHARNLKVSELEHVQGEFTVTKAKLIGHGVLDMWDVPDPGERETANRNGAKEVLEAAIVTNDRVKTEALRRAQVEQETGVAPPPVKIVHVSVNLITPAGWRELPGMVNTSTFHDYQEQTYTKAQFEAFKANSTEGQGGPVTFQLDDDRRDGVGVTKMGQDVDVKVDVDVISFSFGINPLATGKMPDFMGGWDSVYDHNRGMMEKFVGDLGAGEFGARGARPGGFIGSVMDRLDPDVPEEAELLGKLQEQSDLVRTMFTEESFKRGNGDPAKMSRHILALQAMAEEALTMKNVVDLGATMSKGCKSDKDRGGVTDVEFKHLMITEDMGGHIEPDTRLEGEDQQNYYVIATSSGQLENQLYNTGLAGSKEAGKLKQRIPDTDVRQYLSGLGAFASE